jgi:hypothetical protein
MPDFMDAIMREVGAGRCRPELARDAGLMLGVDPARLCALGLISAARRDHMILDTPGEVDITNAVAVRDLLRRVAGTGNPDSGP